MSLKVGDVVKCVPYKDIWSRMTVTVLPTTTNSMPPNVCKTVWHENGKPKMGIFSIDSLEIIK